MAFVEQFVLHWKKSRAIFKIIHYFCATINQKMYEYFFCQPTVCCCSPHADMHANPCIGTESRERHHKYSPAQ